MIDSFLWGFGAVIVIILPFIVGGIGYSFSKHFERLECSDRTQWGSINRLGEDIDELRARIWKLEHKND